MSETVYSDKMGFATEEDEVTNVQNVHTFHVILCIEKWGKRALNSKYISILPEFVGMGYVW